MEATTFIILTGAGINMLSLLYTRLPFFRNRYKYMNKEKLIETNVATRMMGRRLLIPQFIILPVLLIFSALWFEGRISSYLVNTIIFFIFLLSSARIIIWKIRVITTAEREIRKV